MSVDGSWRPGATRILLVEDMDLLRGALVTLLSDEPGFQVVADVNCHGNVLQVAVRLRPDVAIVDIDLTCEHGLATVQALRAQLPECRVVVLVAAKPAGMLRRALAADVAGAVDKNAPAERLLKALHGVVNGELMIDPALAVAAVSAEPNPFTPRELQVLRLAADGATGTEIAATLSLSKGTVRNYLSRVMTKTRARSRIDAIRIVREEGWL